MQNIEEDLKNLNNEELLEIYKSLEQLDILLEEIEGEDNE